MVTVIIVILLKYSVEILVGNKKVGKHFGRYKNSRLKFSRPKFQSEAKHLSHFRPTFF